MFRTVRHWWDSGRGKITLRLFLFEFTVVTLGVLFAQVLQGFAENRSAITRMEQERMRARGELERVRLVSAEWLVAVPCLDRRMDDIMAGRLSAEQGGLVRPALNSPSYSPPDDDSLVLIERRYGNLEKATLAGIVTNVANIHDVTTKIIDHWGRLALIDPTLGPVGAEDRTQARLAAADIKAQLHSAAIISNDSNVRLGRIGIRMLKRDDLAHGPAHSCAAIWRSSRIDPPLTDR